MNNQPHDMSGGQSMAPNIFDPRKLASLVWRRKFLVALICILGVCGTAYYTSRLTKAYTATASVMMENPVNLEREQSSPGEFPRLSNAYKILALTLLERASEISGEKRGPSEKSPIAPAFEVRIEEQMIYFQVIDGDAERAAKFANAWASAFIERMKNWKKPTWDIVHTHLEKLLAKAQDDLTAKETEFKAFEAKFAPKGVAEQQAKIDDTLRQIRETEALLQTIKEGIEKNDSILAAPLDSTEPRLGLFGPQLAQHKFKLADLRRRMKKGSPEIDEVVADIAWTDAEARDWIASITTRLNHDMVAPREKLQRLNTRIDDLRIGFDFYAANAEQYNELVKILADARKVRDDLKQRIAILEDRFDLNYSYATPVTAAYANTAPVRPDWKKNVATGAFASLFIALLLVIGMEIMDQTVKTTADVEKIAGSTIGFVPRLKLTDADSRGALCLTQNSFAADSLRNLQVRLDMILGVRRPGQASVIVVTSPLPGEGKSFLAANIASFFATAGQNVLLIDADFRKARLTASHRGHGRAGLADAIVSGTWNRDDVMKTDIPGCSFLPVGTQGEKGLRHVNPSSMEQLIGKIKADYDVIVIDTAPVLAMADVCIMAAISDMTVLGVRSRRSKFVHVQRASEMLQAAKPKSFGVVVNAVEAADAKSEDYYFASTSYGHERREAVQQGADAT